MAEENEGDIDMETVVDLHALTSKALIELALEGEQCSWLELQNLMTRRHGVSAEVSRVLWDYLREADEDMPLVLVRSSDTEVSARNGKQ